jgi:hypothetical protein
MIKKILIGFVLVIVAAGIALGILYLIRPNPQAKAPVSTKLVLDHSKDYGACTLLDSSSIKAALGKAAANLQQPINVGITNDNYFGDGAQSIVSDSQTCIYSFAPADSTKNTVSATDGLTIKKTMLTTKEGTKALIDQTKSDTSKTEVSALGDIAFYNADTTAQGPDATYNFILQVFNGNESISYTISQSAKSATFTAITAKAGLILLAK